MKILKVFITILLILVINGCSEKECKPVTKIKYIKIERPEVSSRPEFKKYKLYFTNINNKTYVLIPKEDAVIIKNNWILYKNWCEENIYGK